MKYKVKKGDVVEEHELEAPAFLLITSIDNLTAELRRARLGR